MDFSQLMDDGGGVEDTKKREGEAKNKRGPKKQIEKLDPTGMGDDFEDDD